MGEIFLSYSRHDQEFADSLSGGLQARGLQVWVDTHEIQAGDAWRAAIATAITQCDAFLVILSPNCIASKNVVKELSIAESKNRHIVPIMCQTCEIPPEMEYQLAGLQWIDFSELGFENALDRLVKTLQGGPSHPAPGPVRAAAPAPPQPQPAPPGGSFPAAQVLPRPQELGPLLVGRWNVQIGAVFGAVGQLVLDLYPNGAFNGQLMTPAGLSNVAGQWQIAPTGQLMLQGQQSLGWVANPYMTLVQFSQITPQALTGMTSAGEQVTWSRIS